MRSWLVLIACAGCGRVDFNPGGNNATDALGDGPPACNFGTWSTPTNVAELNTSGDEWAADVTDGGLTIYFSSSRAGGLGGLDIWRATRTSTSLPFGNLTNVTELNTANNDIGPEITVDGLTMYFATDDQARDLYTATRAVTTDPFSGITRFAAVDSTGVDDAPSISDDGLVLLFRSDRAGNSDVYLVDRNGPGGQWGPVKSVTTVNSASTDEGTAISADGLTIMFGSNRAGGPGNMDIYTASRPSRVSSFAAPQLVAELSSPSNDDDLDLSDDGQTVYFSSDRGGGAGGEDIWMSTRSCL